MKYVGKSLAPLSLVGMCRYKVQRGCGLTSQDKKKNHWNLIVSEFSVEVYYPIGNGRENLFFSFDLNFIPSFSCSPPKKFILRYRPQLQGLETEHVYYTRGVQVNFVELTQLSVF